MQRTGLKLSFNYFLKRKEKKTKLKKFEPSKCIVFVWFYIRVFFHSFNSTLDFFLSLLNIVIYHYNVYNTVVCCSIIWIFRWMFLFFLKIWSLYIKLQFSSKYIWRCMSFVWFLCVLTYIQVFIRGTEIERNRERERKSGKESPFDIYPIPYKLMRWHFRQYTMLI